MEIEKLLDEYVERFDENVPIAAIRGKTDEEIEKMIKDSIEKEKPIDIEYDPDCAY